MVSMQQLDRLDLDGGAKESREIENRFLVVEYLGTDAGARSRRGGQSACTERMQKSTPVHILKGYPSALEA